MSGCVSSVSTASRSPLTTFRTPSGSPASLRSEASRNGQLGSFSDGFRTNVFPQAIATGNIHIGTMAGKLNGVMPAQTPTGWRIDQLSMPAPTLSVKSPRSRCGMPQANSTTSRPRMTSPRASDRTLPCSSVMSRASSSRCVSMSDLKRNSTRARCRGGRAAHAGSARRAEAIAAEVSAALARASARGPGRSRGHTPCRIEPSPRPQRVHR